MTTFRDLNLRPELVRVLEEKGYKNPTPIQAQAIPKILEGHDLVGCAQTGTGKTASFVLPILHHLYKGTPGRLRALILVPTRELAAQVSESIRTYGRHLPLRSAAIFGGVPMVSQQQKLRQGIDLLVATPGRLLDLLERGNVNFKNLEFFVLDEADRMLDMGFIGDVRKIARKCPSRRKTMLFSATMPEPVHQLAKELLISPVRVEVSRQSSSAEGINQEICPVGVSDKRNFLQYLIKEEKMLRTLVFTRTKRGVDKLSKFLCKNGFPVAAIHGNKSQAARTQALEGFRKCRVEILIATDVASRGLDVKGISHVINFDVPHSPEDYVHRIGRTARAGKIGNALTLMSPEEKPLVNAIEKLIGKRIPVRKSADFTAGSKSHPSLDGDKKPGVCEPYRTWGPKKKAFAPFRKGNGRSRRYG